MIPVVDLPSDPDASGRQHGSALGPEIRSNVAFYKDQLLALGASAEAIQGQAADWIRSIERSDPDYKVEMDAIGASAGIPALDMAILCGRYELVYAATVARQAALVDGCTSVAVRDSHSADGHFLLAQNWDWLTGALDGLAVLRQRGRHGGPDVVAMSEAGIPGGKIGFNGDGLGLVVNGLAIRGMGLPRSDALPFHARCAQILRQSRFDRAIGAAISPAHSGAAFFMLAQTGGEIIGLETWPGSYRALYDTDGLLTHANHFEGAEPPPSALEFNGPHSLFRAARLRNLIRAHGSRVAVDDIVSALSDHFSYPASLCRHEDVSAPATRRIATGCAVVMDLDRREMVISSGPPCEGRLQTVRLP